MAWHRRNGHSVTMGAFFAALVYILASLFNTPAPPYVWAMAVFFPWLLHIIIDQFGHMGNNLFWPFTRHRNSGLGLISASDPYWNFLAIYSAVALIFWNINRAAQPWLSAEAVAWSGVPLWYYALLVIVIPLAIIGGLTLIYKTYFEGKGVGEPPVKSAAARIIEELQNLARKPTNFSGGMNGEYFRAPPLKNLLGVEIKQEEVVSDEEDK